MNTQTQEALKMAIEALEKLARLGNGDSYGNSDGNCIAISALKAITFALAQPVQEPVAWMVFDVYGNGEYVPNDNNRFFTLQTTAKQKPIPLYTHPAPKPECSNHPDAPHGFCRDASHSADRYVCECEGWEALEQPLTRDWKETIDERIAKDDEFKQALEQTAQNSKGFINPEGYKYDYDTGRKK